MSKRDCTLYIIDVFIAYNKIKRYIKDISSAEELLHSELQWDAVIRELQIIGESIKQLQLLKLIDARYRKIVDFRNQIVHGYFGIDEEIVWNVINEKIDILYNDLYKCIKDQNIDVTDAINAAIEENSFNSELIFFLKSIL